MVDFAALKRNRNTDISKLVEAAESAGGAQTNQRDDRFWQPERDKAGNGYAVVRFLPGDPEAATPWVQYWDHAFKGPTGQWYIEKSLSSLGRSDPLGELNGKMWNEPASFGMSEKEAQNIVRQRKRNLRYISNVLVISDPANPENEGKVKLYRYGKKIHNKILDAMKPQFPDEKPINPYDFWEGADFVIKIRMVEGYPNYDTSTFKQPTALFGGDDDKLEDIFNKQHDLSEWTDPNNYKSYDELKARLSLVLGEAAPRTTRERVSLDETASAPRMKEVDAPPIRTAESVALEDEDDTMSYFAKLAQED
jgi:hypothetical protein